MGGSAGLGSGGGFGSGMGAGMSAMGNQIASQVSADKILNLSRFDFVIQFVWMETPPSTRDERKRAAAEAAAAEAGYSDLADEDADDTTTP